MRLHLFGPLAVDAGGSVLGPRDFGGVKPKQILEILLIARGHPVPKERLADLLWGESLPQNRAGALETYVSVLRRRLDPSRNRGHELVLTQPGAYRFATDRVTVDLDQFDEHVERAGAAGRRQRREHLEAAVALVRGEILEDEPYTPWVEELREHYRARALRVILDAADAAMADGDLGAGLAHAARAAGTDQLCEQAYRSLMLAHYALGHQVEALRAYDLCESRLVEQLGVDPMAETRRLRDEILRQTNPASLLPRPAPDVHVRAERARALPLLGRARHLAALESVTRDALDASCACILVEGEAGIGKTRLLDELVGRLDAPVGRASCSALTRDLPNVPVAAALRDAVPDADGLDAILDAVVTAGPGDGTARLRALDALADLVERAAPLVLVLDDLQWADACTLATIEYLQVRCSGAGLAVLGAVRAEDVGPDHPLLQLAPTTRLRLEPLAPEDLVRLDVAGLHARTGGNPRFIAAWLEARAAGSPETMPDAIRHSVLARCRSVGGRGHQLLIHASLLEQPFGPELLAALVGGDAMAVAEELEQLCERGLLTVRGPGFAFRYDLVRDVVCHSLSPARQRVLRARAAELLESITTAAGPAVGTPRSHVRGRGASTAAIAGRRARPRPTAVDLRDAGDRVLAPDATRAMATS